MKSINAAFTRSSIIVLICLIGSFMSTASSIESPNGMRMEGDKWEVPNPEFTENFADPPQKIDAFIFQKDGEDRLVLGGTYTLGEDEILNGDLVIAGGNATLETGSEVKGDILALGGSLRANGLVEGDILALGGQVYLGENASVQGSVNILGGRLERVPGSLIEGEEGFSLPAPMLPGLPNDLAIPEINLGLSPIWKLFWILMRSFLWAAVAVLVTLFLPVSTRRVSQVISGQPMIAGGLGCLTVMVAPIILFIIGITIIGIPISVLAVLILLIAWCFGIIAAGLEVGRRLASAFRQEWALPVSAALGVFLLTIVINSIDAVIPCVGWVLPFLVGLFGLGAVILSRFGTSQYPSLAETHETPAIEIQTPPQSEGAQ
ncbi:MAG: hypothetical protein A2Z16_17185 [Chloroflexi bacterium RBG_16_54_18]|nr:MAG: hypothetical protein A2Z16_17185 [Chloroflexi bacterium RBG_16_54_18]